MRNSLYLAAFTALSLSMAAPAMADSTRSSLDAQSMNSAQVQTESKGFFSGLGDRMHGFFDRTPNNPATDVQRTAEAGVTSSTDASGGVLVQDDTIGGLDSTSNIDAVSRTHEDDTVENNEEAGASGSASTSLGVGAGIGDVDANIGVNADNDSSLGIGTGRNVTGSTTGSGSVGASGSAGASGRAN